MKKVAVIGAGITGLQAVKALLTYSRAEVYLFDGTPHALRGLPFTERNEELLLNQPKHLMALFEADRSFSSWLDHKGLNSDQQYVSRSVFGDYVFEYGRALLNEKRVHWFRDNIIDIKKVEDVYHLQGRNLYQGFSEVYITAGNLTPADPYGLSGRQDYIHDPYPVENWLGSVRDDSSIGIIGTGLSAIDVFRVLEGKTNVTIVFLSRDGVFPTVRVSSKEPLGRHLKSLKPGASLKEVIEAFHEDALAEGADPSSIPFTDPGSLRKSLMMQLKNHDLGILQKLTVLEAPFDEIWKAFSEEDRREFNKKYRKRYSILQSPFPKTSAKRIIRALKENRLKVELITSQEDILRLKLDLMINATGPSLSLDKAVGASPLRELLQNGLKKGLIKADSEGRIDIDFPSFISADPNIRIFGQPVSEYHFGNNSVTVLGEAVVNTIKRS